MEAETEILCHPNFSSLAATCFVGTAKCLGPVKVGARTLLILSSKAVAEDGAEAELQLLLCACEERQRAHTNRAHSTDTVWAYKRSTVISSMSLLLLLSQQQLCRLSFPCSTQVCALLTPSAQGWLDPHGLVPQARMSFPVVGFAPRTPCSCFAQMEMIM